MGHDLTSGVWHPGMELVFCTLRTVAYPCPPRGWTDSCRLKRGKCACHLSHDHVECHFASDNGHRAVTTGAKPSHNERSARKPQHAGHARRMTRLLGVRCERDGCHLGPGEPTGMTPVPLACGGIRYRSPVIITKSEPARDSRLMQYITLAMGFPCM